MSARATAWGAYKSIADAMRQRIIGGEFAAGALLPSEAALTAEYHVARNTLRRALADLEAERLLTTIPGRGRVVSSPEAPKTEAPRLQYQRIAAKLREQIEQGELPPGNQVPSESALTAQYGVSRGTARQALAALQGTGLVRAVHGKGWFVCERNAQDV